VDATVGIFTEWSQGCADWGVVGRHAPIIFKFARKLIKKQPAVGEIETVFFLWPFFSNISWSVVQNAPQQKVSRHITEWNRSLLKTNVKYSISFNLLQNSPLTEVVIFSIAGN